VVDWPLAGKSHAGKKKNDLDGEKDYSGL